MENFIEEACIFTWNAGFILLTPELRGHVLKPFNRAVTALEEIGRKKQTNKSNFKRIHPN
jgi:hypothetical protein